MGQTNNCPLWVISGRFATTLRMSAFGGKADSNHRTIKCPLIAKSGPTGTTGPALAGFLFEKLAPELAPDGVGQAGIRWNEGRG